MPEQKLPAGWEIVDGKVLQREFKFVSYKDVIQFVNKVAKIAEANDHHPDMEVYYSKVIVKLTTHSAGGLTNKDYQVAAEINWEVG